jgi:hypothetical protein
VTALPKQMSEDDVAGEIGVPDGYRRPMSCTIHSGTATRTEELGIELAVARRPDVTTDDSAEIAALVDEIDMKPHLFAEKHLDLTRRVERLEQMLRVGVR